MGFGGHLGIRVIRAKPSPFQRFCDWLRGIR